MPRALKSKHIAVGACAFIAVLTLGGCSSDSFSNLSNVNLVPKLSDFTKTQSGGTISRAESAKLASRPITPDDLITADGRCAARAAAAPDPGTANVGGPAGDPGGPQAVPGQPTLAGGIALGMTECEVVQRAGYTPSIDIRNDPQGERTAVLTYSSGERPGIYRFTAGHLTSMERVATAEPERKPARKTAKKRKPQQASR